MADLLSSPDPLNDSPTFQPPPKMRRASRATSTESLQPQNSSPTKQTFELDVGNQISPQKIRVTVEAGSSDTENRYTHFVGGTQAADASPSRSRVSRLRERTVTTTVPVKGLSDSEDDGEEATTPKRGRGRPRKSFGTPIPAKKNGRAGTPTGKVGRKRRSVGDLVDGDDEEDYDFQIGKSVQVGRGKGTSRSRSIKGTSRKSTPTTKRVDDRVASRATSKNRRARRGGLLPDEIMVLEDESTGADVKDPEPALNGVLQDIGCNDANSPPAFSTIRSSTTVGGNDPDIVIARFNPGHETPQRAGWSSPRNIEGMHASSPAFYGYLSPSASPDKNTSQFEESTAMVHVSPTQLQYNGNDGGLQYQDETEDGLGDMPEFDTVLESEGFSMISVDSVPSLKQHLSSPASQADKGLLNQDKNLAFVKGLEGAAQIDLFSSIPDNFFKLATEARKAQNPNLLSIQNSRIDDSFSSIPPEVLEAATPARKTRLSKPQSTRGFRKEDSFSSIAPDVFGAATPGRDVPETKFNNNQAYEDSFSAISPAVLDAATPAPVRQTSPDQSSIHTNFPALSCPTLFSGRNSTTARLPTPEETPSPLADSAGPSKPGFENLHSEAPAVVPVDNRSVNEPSMQSQMRSSPPSLAPRRYTYTAHLRKRQELYPEMTQTPSIVFSSPSLPPPIHLARAQPALAVQTEEIQRPGLSPIARAGRALQDAVGPVLSPRSRAYSLGSPFKSPINDRKSSSGIKPSKISQTQERLANPLTRLDSTGKIFPNSCDDSVHHDDPFSNNISSRQHPVAQAQKHAYTLGLPENRQLSDPRLSSIGSEGNSQLSNDAMSWQAEEEVTANHATISLVNSINPSVGQRGSSLDPSHLNTDKKTQTPQQRWATERAVLREQIENASTSQAIFIGSDDEVPAANGIEEDDEEFGLLLETLNSSSPEVHQPQVVTKDNVEKPRRGKLPSPWRKNSKRLVYSDELAHLSSSPNVSHVPLGKDFSKRDISDDGNALDLSSFIIPQKSNFKPRARDSGVLDLSALLASSPNKSKLPVLTQSSAEPQLHSFAAIPQKVGFEPRARNVDTNASSIFGSSPLKLDTYVNNIFDVHSNKETHNPTPEISSSSAAEPLGLSSPSRTNSLRIPAQQTIAQLSESDYSYDDSLSPTSEQEKENQSIDNRTLKWTETVPLVSTQMQPLVSPTKSCLRSPLKTPSNGSGSGSHGANTPSSKNVAFISSSPVPSSPSMELLSSTIWSKDHWILLDSILQAWKPEKNGGSEDGPRGHRRNSTRVISRLLGKKVFSQGDEMRLKQWHLEVVDEFRGIVPGWEEKTIAMRVFACLVGEEKRKLGLIGRKVAEQNV